jgi:hypothetical protein
VEIEERLSRLAQQLREREIAGSRVALLRRRQGEPAAELGQLREQHALEQRDVEKLGSADSWSADGERDRPWRTCSIRTASGLEPLRMATSCANAARKAQS